MRHCWRANRTFRLGFGAAGVLTALATTASGQGVVGAPLPSGTPAALPPNAAVAGGVAVLLLGIGLFVIIGVAVKLIDLSRKRTEEAMYVQARIGDVWLQHPTLAMLPIAVTVHVSVWRGSPAAIDVTGRVPTPALRDAAVNLAIQEASRSGIEFHVNDRMTVGGQAIRRAA
jgi:hypothetical protein